MPVSSSVDQDSTIRVQKWRGSFEAPGHSECLFISFGLLSGFCSATQSYDFKAFTTIMFVSIEAYQPMYAGGIQALEFASSHIAAFERS